MLACILCSANGILFGYDTGIIGPVTDMEYFKEAFGGSKSATIHGLIVSSILIPAALSSFFAGHLADKVGRAMGISIGTFIFGVGAAIEASAVQLGMFVGGRVIEGLGEGLFLGNLVVYICEVSPTKNRGPLTTGPQLIITSGILLGYFTCYGTSKHLDSSFSWRTPFILLSCMAMALSALSLLLLPPSPRWLSLHGREEEAVAAWEHLGINDAEREKVELEPEEKDHTLPKQGAKEKLLDIFSKDVRSRTILAVFFMAMQQLAGIDGVLYVSEMPNPGGLSTRYTNCISVCPPLVSTGWTHIIRRKLLCFGYFRPGHLCRDDPRSSICRPVGTSSQHHLWRHWACNHHVRDRRTLCRKCRSRFFRRWSLGRNRFHLFICCHILCDLGS